MKSTVDIVIPTLLKKPELLIACLQSLQEQTSKSNVHVWVIANICQSKLDTFLRENASVEDVSLDNISWHATGSNKGFTGAVNSGVSLGSAPVIVLLNDDTQVTPEWLDELLKKQEDENVDMVASHIILASDKKTVDSLGFTFLWRGKAIALTSTLVPLDIANAPDYWLKNQDLLNEQSEDISFFQEPFGPDAAAALYTRSLWEKLGGMNDAFFAYLEDVDFALRARKIGAHCVLADKAVAYHHKHATSENFSGFKAKQDMYNWWRIVIGSYPSSAWGTFFVAILLERARNVHGFFKQIF